MGRMQLEKGKTGEREVASLLQPVVNAVYAEFGIVDPIHVPKIQRNKQQSDGGGFDLIGIPWLALEVKFQKELRVDEWWRQTKEQARLRPGTRPVLAYRINKRKWTFRLMGMLPTPGSKITCPVDVPASTFLVYLQTRLREELRNAKKTT